MPMSKVERVLLLLSGEMLMCEQQYGIDPAVVAARTPGGQAGVAESPSVSVAAQPC